MEETINFEVYKYSDIGYRDRNQDAYYYAYGFNPTTKKQQGIFAVADGIAGAGCQYSEIAAQKAVDFVRRWWIGAMPLDEALILERLNEGFEYLQDELKEYAGNPENGINRYGTTLSVLVIYGDKGYFGHIGDSVICANGPSEGYRQFSETHATVRPTGGKKNVLTRCLSNLKVPSIAQVGSFDLDQSQGQWYFVVTDGALEGGARYNINKYSRVRKEEVCHEIVRQSRRNGGKDNATVIGITF